MARDKSRMFAHIGSIIIVVVAVLLFGSTCDDSAPPDPSAPDIEQPSSHEWTWEFNVIDPGRATGWLWDVCYINDTCIWAVGIIHSTELYNACRWNGRKWLLEKVYDDPTGSATEPGVHELKTVVGISPDDVWFCRGTVFVHWNGSEFETHNYLIEALLNADEMMQTGWGSSGKNIYLGGSNGGIVHFDGHRWKRLKTDIEWDIAAMHGVGDTLLVAATDWEYTGNTKFYMVVGESVTFLMENKYVRGVDALWYSHLSDVYTAGPYNFHYNGTEWKKTRRSEQLPVAGFSRDMAANNHCDIFDCGDFGTIRHFNGEDWRIWKDVPGYEYAQYNACTIKGNDAWVVGVQTEGYEVLIVKGSRTGN